MTPTLQQLGELDQINYKCAAIAAALDNGEYEPWLAAFLPDALYSAVTAGNLADGINLFTDFGVDGRKERVAFWLGMWQVGRSRIRHLVGRSRLIAAEESRLKVETSFMMTHTGNDGETRVHASGVYQDDWVQVDGDWMIGWRRVVVDCDVLPSSFTDPL